MSQRNPGFSAGDRVRIPANATLPDGASGTVSQLFAVVALDDGGTVRVPVSYLEELTEAAAPAASLTSAAPAVPTARSTPGTAPGAPVSVSSLRALGEQIESRLDQAHEDELSRFLTAFADSPSNARLAQSRSDLDTGLRQLADLLDADPVPALLSQMNRA